MNTVNRGEFEQSGEFEHRKFYESTANNFLHII